MNDQVTTTTGVRGERPGPEGAGLQGAGLQGAGLQGAGLQGAGLQGAGPDKAGTTQPYLNNLVTAVHAPAMSLSGRDGQMRRQGVEGLYVQDLRALSELVLTVNGSEPVPLGYEPVGGAVNEFYGAVAGAGNPGPDLTVFVSRTRALNPAGMVETYRLKSYARTAIECHVELQFGSDLAGIAAVRSGLRPAAQKAAPSADGPVADGLVWDVPRRGSVHVGCSPRPGSIDAVKGSVSWDFVVGPGEEVTWLAAVELRDLGTPVVFVEAPPGTSDNFPVPQVDASDHRLKKWVELSVEDLKGLRMVAPAHPSEVFVAAGAPWYLTLFGRDSLWAARLLLPLGSDLALGTLQTLARRQGQAFDKTTGEQPGKILHEVRRPDSSTYLKTEDGHNERIVSLPPVYYGTVDATPLWVCLLHDAWKWGMPTAEVEALLDPMQRCLAWLTELGCRADGFVSYIDESGQGLANQGWKDSWDAVQFRDGRIARAPLALCEVQGYAYEAAMGGAELLDAFGQDGAARWRDFAAGLSERFRARFWVDDADGAYPAIALEEDGTPVDSLSSNIGHLLGTGLLSPPESDLVAKRLLGADLNSGFGLRTLAASSAGFNPLSYHCGSVWAHDTAIVIAGLARTPGPVARDAAASLVEGLLGAAEGFGYRLPELYGGHSHHEQGAPLPYPASCHPQAWAAASSIGILGALLGIRPDVPAGTVGLAPMAAAAGVGNVTGLRSVNGLRIGDAPVAICVDGEKRLAGGPPALQVAG
jgi:glycogen debranching enzyme